MVCVLTRIRSIAWCIAVIKTLMKIRTGILRRVAALTLVGLASQMICRAELVSVNSITNSATTIGLFFDPAVTTSSATNPANYTVFMKTGAVSIASVTLQTNGQFVALNLATPIGEFFTVTASNVVDVASGTNNAYTMGYLSDYDSRSIGVSGNPNPTGSVFTAHGDTFEVTTGGSDVGGTNDFFHFISQQVVSNFDMSVLVERLDQVDAESKAGLMAREFMTRGSRTLQTYVTPTGGSNEVIASVRAATNGTTTSAGFQAGAPAPANVNPWLRLTRTNNLFTSYYSSNGVDWTVSGVTTQAFAATLNIGMMTASHTTNGTATVAKFTQFVKSGVRPGDNVLPTLNVTLTGGTNILLNWLRTPRDYLVEISTNLTDWGILLLPILEAGTNANAREMNLPLFLVNSPTYLRLLRVERVMPDPPPYIVTSGAALSPGLGLTSGAPGGLSLCPATSNILVLTNFAQAQSAAQVIAPLTSTVTFKTTDSSQFTDTALQVRLVSGTTVCDDNSGGEWKSKILRTSSATSMTNTYGLIVAPKQTPAANYNQTSILKITIVW